MKLQQTTLDVGPKIGDQMVVNKQVGILFAAWSTPTKNIQQIWIQSERKMIQVEVDKWKKQ